MTDEKNAVIVAEYVKKFEFHIDDLTDEAKGRFIKFLGTDNGDHDIISFCVYETICEDGDCKGCEWKCTNGYRDAHFQCDENLIPPDLERT